MLSFLLFIIVIILAVSLSHKDRDVKQKLDHSSMSYRQGYWDGVRASELKVSSTNSGDDTSVQALAVSDQQEDSVVPIVGQPPAPDTPQPQHKDNHLTVNIALYVASLLLIGGVSSLVRAFTPGVTTTFFLVLMIAVAYYGFGFMLYRSTPILKPVSVAFIGTALAIVPYAGYLLNQSFVHNGSASWLVTSLVCLAAYLYAAIRLHSELIGYCIIIIIISTADSLAGVFSAGMLWFVVLLMAVGAAITFISAARPSWLPEVLKRPFIATQHILVPLAVLWSLFLYSELDAAQYAIVFAVATLYYAAAALQAVAGSVRRTWLWASARATLTVAAGFLTYEITSSMYAVGATLAAVGVLQVIVSALSLPIRQKLVNQHEVWLWGGFALIVIAALFSTGEVHWARQVTIELAGLTVIATLVASYLKRSDFLVFSVYGLILLPLIGGHYFEHSVIADWAICIIYGVMALLTVFVRLRYVRSENQTNMVLVYTAQIAFSFMMIAMGTYANTDSNHWWLTLAWVVVTAVVFITSWIERDYRVVIAANSMAVLTLGIIAYAIGLEYVPAMFFIAALSLIGFYCAYLVLQYKAIGLRVQRTMWGFALVVTIFLSIIGVSTQETILIYGFTLLLLAAGSALIYDDYENRRLRFADVGLIVAVIGLQRLLAAVAPDISWLFYSHWWALLGFTLAYLRIKYANASPNKNLPALYQIVALTILTMGGFAYAGEYKSESWPQALFLLEQVGFVVYGLVRNNTLYTIWGAAGATLAILIMLPILSGFLLPLLGLGIIIVVVRVVTRNSKTPPPLPPPEQ